MKGCHSSSRLGCQYEHARHLRGPRGQAGWIGKGQAQGLQHHMVSAHFIEVRSKERASSPPKLDVYVRSQIIISVSSRASPGSNCLTVFFPFRGRIYRLLPPLYYMIKAPKYISGHFFSRFPVIYISFMALILALNQQYPYFCDPESPQPQYRFQFRGEPESLWLSPKVTYLLNRCQVRVAVETEKLTL